MEDSGSGTDYIIAVSAFFKERLWELYYDIMEPIGPLPPNLY